MCGRDESGEVDEDMYSKYPGCFVNETGLMNNIMLEEQFSSNLHYRNNLDKNVKQDQSVLKKTNWGAEAIVQLKDTGHNLDSRNWKLKD